MIIGQLEVDNLKIEMELIAIGRCDFWVDVNWLIGSAISFCVVKIVMIRD